MQSVSHWPEEKHFEARTKIDMVFHKTREDKTL